MPQDPANPNGRPRDLDPAERPRVAGAVLSLYLHARGGSAGVMALPVGRRPMPLNQAVAIVARQGPLADNPARVMTTANLFAHAYLEGRNELVPALQTLSEGRLDDVRRALEIFHKTFSDQMKGQLPSVQALKTVALRVLVGDQRPVPLLHGR